MLESPFDEPLRNAVTRGRVGETALDDKVGRILGQMDRFGLLDGDQPDGHLDAPEHHALAQDIAVRGTVLLKNEDETLPLADDASIAVIGPNVDTAKVGGGGSSEVDPSRATDPLSGVRERANGTVRAARGIDRVEEPEMVGGLLGQFGGDDEADPSIDDALAAARAFEVAVVFVQDAATETADRSLWLPGDQDELVARVADEAARTVVVCNTGGPVRMPWAADVDAIVEGWYPGQAHGDATASVLFGDADPSGRLPVTFGRRLDDYPTGEERRYPGDGENIYYVEGVFVGYRGFDADDVDPLFPFGHGESYATFEYGDCELDQRNAIGDASVDGGNGGSLSVSVPVTNVGERRGREVVQVYVAADEASVERPPKELAGFAAVELDAGESTTVTCDVDERAFAYYDEDADAWTVEAGEFEILVGRSSRDVRDRAPVTVDENVTLR